MKVGIEDYLKAFSEGGIRSVLSLVDSDIFEVLLKASSALSMVNGLEDEKLGQGELSEMLSQIADEAVEKLRRYIKEEIEVGDKVRFILNVYDAGIRNGDYMDQDYLSATPRDGEFTVSGIDSNGNLMLDGGEVVYNRRLFRKVSDG